MGPLGRRQVLMLGGAAAAGGLRMGSVPAYATQLPPYAEPPLEVSEQHAGRTGIDLRAQGQPLIEGGRLHHSTVLQSFAFDESRGHLYALQVVEGGVRLHGERRTYTHAERAIRGDLCLNQLTMTGTRLAHMYLTGFGHGGALGVDDRARGGPVLWTEWDANPASGYGRGICRFRFRPGAVLRATDPLLETFRPKPGTTKNHPAIDPHTRRLLLRYRRDGGYRYAVYDLRRFAAHDFRPLADYPQPASRPLPPFQGMTLCGEYAYQMTGTGYGAGNPRSGRGNTRLFRFDLRSGKVVQVVRTEVGRQLHPREPEGLAMLRGGGTRLCVGFTSGPPRGRRYSLYGLRA